MLTMQHVNKSNEIHECNKNRKQNNKDKTQMKVNA